MTTKKKSKTSKRTVIEPKKGDRRYLRRSKKGEFKKQVKVGRSLAADRKRSARTKVKKGSRLARRRLIKRAVEESTRTIVSPDGWKLCLRDRDLNELYNLKDDPFETRNLYLDPQYASVVSRLTTEICRWQEATNDKL